MDKNDIINYVMETPGNSNPAVLGSMLDSYSGSSSPLIVHYSDNDNTTLDHTWQEIADAMPLAWLEPYESTDPYTAGYIPIWARLFNGEDGEWSIRCYDF